MTRDPMDEGDVAADYAARHNAAAVAAVLAGMPDPTAESAVDCEWCGAPIDEERRKLVPGCQLCVSCQTQKERLPGGDR